MERLILILFTFLSVVIDLVILNLFLLGFSESRIRFSNDFNTFWIVCLLNFIWILLLVASKLHVLPRLKQRKKIVWNTLIALLVWFFLYFIVNMALNNDTIFTATLIGLLFLTTFLIIVFKLILDSFIRYSRTHGINQKNVLMIGYSKKTNDLKDYFTNNPWSGYRYIGFIHEGECPEEDCISDDYNKIQETIALKKIDELFLNMEVIPEELKHSILSLANSLDFGITLIPDFGDFPSYRHDYQRFDQTPIITVGTDQLSFLINIILKRVFDIIISLAVIILFMWWLLPLVALFIKIDSKGDVFFRQRRTGYKNRTFICLKFRTMVKNEESDLIQASEDDWRVTSFGRILRRTSLDEIPQFFNVLMGQMSMVGPRPHMLKHTEKYSKLIPSYLNRHKFRPGITGLAQIRGHRGETKSLENMKARVELDIYYIEHWSGWLDIKIILITLKNIITGKLGGY